MLQRTTRRPARPDGRGSGREREVAAVLSMCCCARRVLRSHRSDGGYRPRPAKVFLTTLRDDGTVFWEVLQWRRMASTPNLQCDSQDFEFSRQWAVASALRSATLHASDLHVLRNHDFDVLHRARSAALPCGLCRSTGVSRDQHRAGPRPPSRSHVRTDVADTATPSLLSSPTIR